jgi:hypothetical protein
MTYWPREVKTEKRRKALNAKRRTTNETIARGVGVAFGVFGCT